MVAEVCICENTIPSPLPQLHLQLLKLDIIPRFWCLFFGLGSWAGLVGLLLLAHLFFHAAVHFPEAFFHLPGGDVYGNDYPEDQQVAHVNEECV